jgi:HD-like signal output (HDOD) protein
MIEHSHPDITTAELVKRAPELATLPEVYVRVRDVLADPTSSHEAVAAAITTDPALSARLLRIANSAFYGRPGSISTIARAVGLLGTQQVHDLVLATAVIQGFGGLADGAASPRRFWFNSLTTACAAKLLAEHCHILDSERLFVAGLLAQVGQLLLHQALPEAMAEILREADGDIGDVAVRQQAQFGFDYAAVSGELFAAWQLPQALVAPIHHHTTPSAVPAAELEASIVHIAVHLSDAEHHRRNAEDLLAGLNDRAWEIAAISRDELQVLRLDAVALTAEVAPVLLDIAA